MDLANFIKEPQRRNDLAALVNTNADYLYQLATGRRRASTKLAISIDLASERLGPEKVPKESLRPDVWGDKAA